MKKKVISVILAAAMPLSAFGGLNCFANNDGSSVFAKVSTLNLRELNSQAKDAEVENSTHEQSTLKAEEHEEVVDDQSTTCEVKGFEEDEEDTKDATGEDTQKEGRLSKVREALSNAKNSVVAKSKKVGKAIASNKGKVGLAIGGAALTAGVAYGIYKMNTGDGSDECSANGLRARLFDVESAVANGVSTFKENQLQKRKLAKERKLSKIAKSSFERIKSVGFDSGNRPMSDQSPNESYVPQVKYPEPDPKPESDPKPETTQSLINKFFSGSKKAFSAVATKVRGVPSAITDRVSKSNEKPKDVGLDSDNVEDRVIKSTTKADIAKKAVFLVSMAMAMTPVAIRTLVTGVLSPDALSGYNPLNVDGPDLAFIDCRRSMYRRPMYRRPIPRFDSTDSELGSIPQFDPAAFRGSSLLEFGTQDEPDRQVDPGSFIIKASPRNDYRTFIRIWLSILYRNSKQQ